MHKKEIYLCSICNVSSGACSEDCAFCTQSVKYDTGVDVYRYKSIDLVLKEAQFAKKSGAIGFCLVTAGRGIDKKSLEYICELSFHLKKELPDLNLIVCNGIASIEELKELKKSGIRSYNHNLESSKEYYKKICTTHDWDDRYQTCLNVKEVGLELCCGGIFGMGESHEDRLSFVESIKSLSPASVAINFFHPNPSLYLEKNITLDDALFWIKYVRQNLPEAMVMVAGGREITFKDRVGEIFEMGANSIVIGNYLTTKGELVDRDLKMLKDLGLEVAKSCNE